MRTIQASLLLSAALLSMSGTATAQLYEADLEIAAGVTASNNPQLSATGNAGAVLGEVRLEPSLVRRTPRSTVELLGRIYHREYSRLYNSETGGSADLRSTTQLSERLSINGGAQYSQQLAVDAFDQVTAAIDPRSLRIIKAANLGGALALSERSSMTANASVSQHRFRRSEVLQGYDTVGAGIGYMRTLSPTLSVGANAQLSFQDYGPAGSSRVASLYGTANYRLDEHTTATGGLGGEWISIGRSSLPQGGEGGDYLLFGSNASLCRARLRMNLCVNGNVSAGATGFGQLQRQTSVGVSYDYRASERTSYTAGANYNRASSIGDTQFNPVFGANESISFFSMRAGVERRLTRSLNLAGFGGYNQRSGFGTADAFFVGTELRWNWGRHNGRN